MSSTLSTDLLIRKATMDDVGTIVTLGRKTFSDTFAHSTTAENLSLYLDSVYTTNNIALEMEDALSQYFIAEQQGKPVGFLKVRHSPTPEELADLRPLELERLYAIDEVLGKGVGSALMSTCLDYANHHKFDSVWLGVWEFNERAIRFYRKFGFEQFGRHVFMVGNDVQHDFLLRKIL